jgi:hypothetical protein
MNSLSLRPQLSRSPSFPHALSWNPGKPELDPRLKHSGVTLSGNRSSTPIANFQRRSDGHEAFRINPFGYVNFVLFASSFEKYEAGCV